MLAGFGILGFRDLGVSQEEFLLTHSSQDVFS